MTGPACITFQLIVFPKNSLRRSVPFLQVLRIHDDKVLNENVVPTVETMGQANHPVPSVVLPFWQLLNQLVHGKSRIDIR